MDYSSINKQKTQKILENMETDQGYLFIDRDKVFNGIHNFLF